MASPSLLFYISFYFYLMVPLNRFKYWYFFIKHIFFCLSSIDPLWPYMLNFPLYNFSANTSCHIAESESSVKDGNPLSKDCPMFSQSGVCNLKGLTPGERKWCESGPNFFNAQTRGSYAQKFFILSLFSLFIIQYSFLVSSVFFLNFVYFFNKLLDFLLSFLSLEPTFQFKFISNISLKSSTTNRIWVVLMLSLFWLIL
jgi:hypothetical protein